MRFFCQKISLCYIKRQIQTVPLWFLRLEKFINMVKIVNGIIQIKSQFGDNPYLVPYAFGQGIAYHFGMVGDDIQEILFLLKREYA